MAILVRNRINVSLQRESLVEGKAEEEINLLEQYLLPDATQLLIDRLQPGVVHSVSHNVMHNERMERIPLEQ